MFVGQHHHTLDPKKRLVIPAKFRPFFPEEKGIYVTLKTARYNDLITSFLILYPSDAWQKRSEWVEKAALNSEEAEWYLRKFSSDTEYCKIDAQWRVIIPLRLIKSAGLKRDIMIVGVVDKFEVWDLEKWRGVSEWLKSQSTTLEKYTYGADKGA